VEDMTSQDKLNNHTCVCTGHFSEAEVLAYLAIFFYFFFYFLHYMALLI